MLHIQGINCIWPIIRQRSKCSATSSVINFHLFLAFDMQDLGFTWNGGHTALPAAVFLHAEMFGISIAVPFPPWILS